MIITNNGTDDAVITGKVAKNVSGPVNSAVTRTYTVKAGQTITKKLDNTLLSNMHDGDEAFALVLNGSGVSFLLKDTCLEENPCVPAEAIDMIIPVAGSSVQQMQAAGTKWYKVDVTNAKAAEADIQLTMTAASEVDLTVDIAAACAIGEPTQSYTGSSKSTSKTLSYSLFKDADDVVYVRVKANKAITVKAEIIDLVKYTATGWNQTPSEDKAARIEADLTIDGELKVLGITLAGGKISIENGGKLIVGKEGIKGSTTVDQITIEEGGILLIDPAASNNNKPFVTAKKTLHFGAQNAAGATLPELHEFIALPVDNREALAGVRYINWNYTVGWEATDGFRNTFVGYNVFHNTTAAPYDYNALFKGQLADNKNQQLNMAGHGWFAFGNSWTAPIKLADVWGRLGSAQAAIHTYVATPQTVDGVDFLDNYYVPMTSDIAEHIGVTEIAPMQGFFLYTESATTAALNYGEIYDDATTSAASPAPAKRVADNRNQAAVVLRGGYRSDFVFMIEGEATNATKMVNENLAIYAEDELGQVASENLIGTMLSIKTNDATEYTLSFAWLNGETMYLKDLANGNIIAMTAESIYTFNAEPNSVSERFQVVGRNNVVTGMENSAVIEGANKRIENGKVVIIKNGVKYDVLGAQL